MSWHDSAALAARADTGGHHDWRVPTIKELYSLMDFRGSTGRALDFSSVPPDAKPYIDTRYFDFEYPTRHRGGQPARFIDAQYVSSTAYGGLTMDRNKTFFGVNFANGRIKGYPQDGGRGGRGWYLRLVRGNQEYGRNDFRDRDDGSIGDAATGLVWMKSDSGDPTLARFRENGHYGDGRLDWPEALAFCESLELAGSGAWRLPNAKELQSIVDYGRSPQATGTAAIDPVFTATPVTNEAGKPDFAAYWTSTTHIDGRFPGTDAVIVHFGEALGALIGPSRPGMRPGGAGMGMPPPGPHGGFGMGGPGPAQPGMPGPGMEPRRGPGGSGGPGGPVMGMPFRGESDSRSIIDVHGAGAQRSDPKIGDPDHYPVWGHGPQGDVRRVYNYVRCVRDAG